MAGIIKAGAAPLATSSAAAPQGVAFNYDDVARKASLYLEGVRKEANALLAQARQEAERIRRQAEEQGRQAAVKQAEANLAARIEQRLQTALPALDEAARTIRESREAWSEHWAQLSLELAVAIARRLVRGELASQPQITLRWVQEALELAADSDHLKLHLNPQDYQALGEQVRQIGARLGKLGRADVVADPAVSPGGCVVQTRFGGIDQQLEAQLDRIRQELSG